MILLECIHDQTQITKTHEHNQEALPDISDQAFWILCFLSL